MAETTAPRRPQVPVPPQYVYVEFRQILDYHPAVRAMLLDKPPEYSPDLSVIAPNLLVETLQMHPLGVVPVGDQADSYYCFSGIRLYRRLRERGSWNRETPVLLFPKLTLKAILAMAESDYYYAPYLAGPPASARHAHAAVWADAQKDCRIASDSNLTGQSLFATLRDLDERPFLNGKTQTPIFDGE